MKWLIMAVDQRHAFGPGQTIKARAWLRYSMGVNPIAGKNLFNPDDFRITIFPTNNGIASGYHALQTRKRLNIVVRVVVISCAILP